jgi:uncharacterized linocin/CFP29 family protein
MSNVTDALGWDSIVWDPIQKAVHDEAQRSKIGQQILPIYGPLGNTCTVPSDITSTDNNGNGFIVNEGNPLSLIEISVKFALTNTQVQEEKTLSTAVTLATKAANILSKIEDQIIFQGPGPTPKELKDVVEIAIPRGNNGQGGLLGDDKDKSRTIPVKPISGATASYGENTFSAVAEGIAQLQGEGHYGAYALVLNFDQYADTFAPLKDTLATPSDRIKPLVDKGFYGTSAVPKKRGVVVSLAGDSMDLAVGIDTKAQFRSPSSTDSTLSNFRVFNRIVLRLKDSSAVRRLEFQ